METLVDLKILPTTRDYAHWGFVGSGAESFWDDFDQFFEHFKQAKDILNNKLPIYKEDTFEDRFKLICCLNPNLHQDKVKCEHVVQLLSSNYNKTYYSHCFIRDDVRETLTSFKRNIDIGVVSNFKVPRGIEYILQQHRLAPFFNFVITSTQVGWRKPHKAIYKAALKATNVKPDEILFIGDDYENDFIGPKHIGMQALLLDRKDNHPSVEDRVRDFYELQNRLESYYR